MDTSQTHPTHEDGGASLLALFRERAPAMALDAGWPEADAPEAARALKALADAGTDARALLDGAPVLLKSAAASADPPAALHHGLRWIRSAFQPTTALRSIASNGEACRFLLGLFAYSPFLADVCVRNPEYVDWLLTEGDLGREKSAEQYERETAAILRPARSPDARRKALCRYRRRELLRLGARDMTGRADVLEQCREISRLAETAIRFALDDVWRDLTAKHGPPQGAGGDAPTPGFAVIALGKLGGGELNFSSDIDLVFVYDREGQTEGVPESDGRRVRRLAHNEFYARVAAALSGALMDPTEEGVCWRVDARLRPDGASGALARSLDGFGLYFAEQARAWERVAYLKSRFVAGDPAVGSAFEQMAEAFVYSPIDPALLISEIGRLKLRIDNDRLDDATRRLDIKRGPGGIREIEFIATVQQILHGARDRSMRCRATIYAMDALVQAGLMPDDVRERLRESYCLFRRSEHSLQLVADRQTQKLPEGAAERALLGRRLGYGDGDAFEESLSEARKFVRGMFDEMFLGQRQPQERRLADELLGGGDPSAEAIGELESHGLDARESFAALRELAAGTMNVAVPRRAQRLFERFLPALLEELEVAAMPEPALRHMGNFMRAHRAITTLYDLLLENPRIIRLLVRVCGFGQLPSRLMTAHPEWFDELLEGAELIRGAPLSHHEPGHWSRRASTMGTEKALDELRRWKERQAFMASVREILGVDVGPAPGRRLAQLADCCLGAVAEIVTAANGEPQGRWSILALGTYGTTEVHLCGDLDIAFVHSVDSDATEMARIASGVVKAMGAAAPEGRLWPTDSRLRPEGSGAPIAVSLERLERYYQRDAGTWEFQSMTRGRPAAGDLELGGEALSIVSAAWRERRPQALGTEVLEMRRRMEASSRLPRWARLDLKTGSGGLVDVEFLVQYLQLGGLAGEAFAGQGQTPVDVLEAWDGGGGLSAEDAQFLAGHYRRVRAAQRAMRLLFETSRSYLPEDGAKRSAVRRALSAMEVEVDGDDIVSQRCFRRAREVFEAVMGA